MSGSGLTPALTPVPATSPCKSFVAMHSPLQPTTEHAPLMKPTIGVNTDVTSHQPSARPPPVNKVLFLDGLRGLAAMLVVVQHSHWLGLDVGQPGVDTFFVLSAFLLTMIFEKKARGLIAEQANWRRWGWALLDYFSRRFLRVYPLFVVVVLVIWALPDKQKQQYFVFSHPEEFNLFRTLTFQFDYRYHVFWTLPLEIMYYFLIPVFVVVILLLRKCWIIPMIPLTYLVVYSGFYWVHRDHMSFKPHLPTFLCGSMAAIIYAKADQFITKRKWTFDWWSWFLLRTVEMTCMAFLFSCVFEGLLFDWVFKDPIQQGPGGHFVSTNISIIIVCEMLLPGVVSSILEWSLLRYAGKISYSLYLLHSFVVYNPWISRQTYYDRYWAIWGLSFLLSTISYHTIEYPSQWLAGRIGKAVKCRDLDEKKRCATTRHESVPMHGSMV